ncbi:hypothetical protein [Youngiibacter multivorans]|uniref:Uncharacterized protein n=1 Tax=Youngiibacter multivorans TaxID=937251 RepID=A0ABS4G280_9CLOT|nr:hypothetical protein [Youngiibacter multivorans]MBP1918631.1 hypothetical protein [Youngiibacter multivorans]
MKKRKTELLDLCSELGVESKSRWTKGVLTDALSSVLSNPEELAYLLPRHAFLALSGRTERGAASSGILGHFGLEGNAGNVFPELSNKSALKLVKRLDIIEELVKVQVMVCGLIPVEEFVRLVRYSLRNAQGKEWRNLYSDDERLEAETRRFLDRRFSLVRVNLKDKGFVICRDDVTEPANVAYAQEISNVAEYKQLAADELLDPNSHMESDELEKLNGILDLLGTYASDNEMAAMKEALYIARDKIASGYNELDTVRGLAELAAFPGSDELVAFIGAITSWCGSIRRWELKGHTRDEIDDRICDSGD